jgi:hypothetical protein
MLNPSTANEFEDDPTVRKCVSFGKEWGYSGIVIVNLCAIVSADPTKLLTAPDPIGLCGNDKYIGDAAMLASKIIAAWGDYGSHLTGRVEHVLEILNWRPVFCLGINKSGQPRHPLYVKKTPEYALQVYRPSVMKLADSSEIFESIRGNN